MLVLPLITISLILLLIPVIIGVYVYRDSKNRGMNTVLWTVISVVTPYLIGFIVYLFVRERYSNLKCAKCDTVVYEQYTVCPKCGCKLKAMCPNCNKAVEPEWEVCPYCASQLPKNQNDVIKPKVCKDKNLVKVLIAIILIPIIILISIVLFNISSMGETGTSSLGEITFDDYFNDERLPESTKNYVKQWLDGISSDENEAYILCYDDFDKQSKIHNYYYLVYVLNGGETSEQSLEYSTGLLKTKLKLNLNGAENKQGLYAINVHQEGEISKLDIKINGKNIKENIQNIDFIPAF